jgi:multidrug efflux pump subunit AcrA (membrane-fusion protein)
MAITNKKKSNKGLFIGIAVGLIALVVVVVPMMMNAGGTGNYKSASVNKETIETYYTFTGSVGSKNTQSVMAEKIMQISEIKVSEGAKVKKDDVLFVTRDGTKVNAKIGGTVSKINIQADEQVMSGALLCEIYDFDHLQVSVRVDEYDLSAIKTGDKIEVTIDALDKEVTGTVASVSDTAVNQNGVAFFTAKVDLEKDGEVKIGMTAEAKILNKQSKDTLTIPMKALMFDSENNPYIYTKGDKGSMTKTAVVVGINDGKTVEITNGVRNGDTVYYTTASGSEQSGGGFMPPMPGR